MSKKSSKWTVWTVETVLKSVKRNLGVSLLRNHISFDPRGGVGLKTLGKLDYLATQGYTVVPVIPEHKKKK